MNSEGRDQAERLKRARESAGLSPSQAARLLGICKSSVHYVESGVTDVLKWAPLEKACELYDCKLAWVLGTFTEADLDTETIEVVAKLPEPDRGKMLELFAMMDGVK